MKKTIEELGEELSMHDRMILSLIELLEEKGILKESEWREKIEERLGEEI
jgi:hypothetical protein